MNARQAAKQAAKKIEELEFRIAMYIMDVKEYNEVIDALILQKSPCPWCEDYEECQLEAKKLYGCPEWMLHNNAKRISEVDITKDDTLWGEDIIFGGKNES